MPDPDFEDKITEEVVLMYKYETHLHTYPVSRCARAGVQETLAFYKEQGYDGVFITNHFLDGNINWDQNLPYENGINFFFSDYEAGVEIGKAIDLKVFSGVAAIHSASFIAASGFSQAEVIIKFLAVCRRSWRRI